MQIHHATTPAVRTLVSAIALALLAPVAQAQPAEPVPPPPAPAAELPPPPPPAPEPASPAAIVVAKPVPPLPAALAAGTKATFKPGVLLQTHAFWDYVDRATGDKTTNTFRIRRAELTAKGDILPKLFTYSFMFDTARLLEPRDVAVGTPPVNIKQPVAGGATSILQDVFITYNSAYADVSMGQFKTPVGWESYNPTAKTLFPERSIVSTTFADKRDIGFRIAKTFDSFGYSAGLFNGTYQNNLDNNQPKDGALRLEYYPIKGMTIAGVAYGTLWQTKELNARRRYEADLRYEQGMFLFQSEYIYARDRKAKGAFSNTLVKGQGLYAAAGVRILEDLQICARFDYVDPDTADVVDKDHTKGYEGQIVYYLQGHEAKFHLTYAHFEYASGSGKDALNQVTFAAQLWY